MNFRKLRAAVVTAVGAGMALGAGVCFASINGVGDDHWGNPGELVFFAYDLTGQVSYSRDLGLQVPAFKTLATSDGGLQQFWVMEDSNWTRFLAAATPANMNWSVVGYQKNITLTGGDFTPNAVNVYSTISTATTTSLATTTNTQFVNNFSQRYNFGLSLLNNTSDDPFNGHYADPPDFAVNETSFEPISQAGYFGNPDSFGTLLNNDFRLQIGTGIGRSAWFYSLTTSSNVPQNLVAFSEFRNRQPCAPTTAGTCAGYFGFVYVDPTLYPTSTYVGKYLLSYTIQPCTDASCLATSQALREFAAGIGRTEVTGALWTQRLDGVATAAGTEFGAGFSRRLLDDSSDVADSAAGLLATTTPVPEPAAPLLWLGGLLGLAGLRATRRQRPLWH